MSVELLQYLGISSVLLIIAGFLAKYLILNILKRDLEETKKELQRELSLEARKDAYKTELAIRQLNAAEEMWSLFNVTSLSNIGETIIINVSEENPQFIIEQAVKFVNDFNKMFSTKSGLYISKKTRKSLHAFRDYINETMINQYRKTQNRALTTKQIDEFKKLRKVARLDLRNEVGSVNITLANEEYNN